jgi:hypothetical protein
LASAVRPSGVPSALFCRSVCSLFPEQAERFSFLAYFAAFNTSDFIARPFFFSEKTSFFLKRERRQIASFRV